MKVLVCHNDYQQRGGESEVVDREIQLMKEMDIEVVQYRVHNDEIRQYSTLQKLLFIINTVFNLSSYRRMTKLINEHKPDVVHVHNVFPLLSPSIYYACFRHKIPVVQTVHNFRFFCPNGLFFTKGNICERCAHGNYFHSIRFKCYRDDVVLSALYAFVIWLHRLLGLLRRVDLYVALTEFSKEKLVELGIKRSKIYIKPNFLLVNKTTSDNYGNGEYGLFLGRYANEKGIETLLSSIQLCAHQGVSFKFAGGGVLESSITSKILSTHLPIELLGYVSGTRKEKIIQKSKYVIIPSECYENMPTVVLEAYMFGKPVIASRIGSLPFIVEHEQTGLLFSPGNYRELSEMIIRLETDPELLNKMSVNVLLKFNKLYNSVHQKEYIKELYSLVMNMPRTHE